MTTIEQLERDMDRASIKALVSENLTLRTALINTKHTLLRLNLLSPEGDTIQQIDAILNTPLYEQTPIQSHYT